MNSSSIAIALAIELEFSTKREEVEFELEVVELKKSNRQLVLYRIERKQVSFLFDKIVLQAYGKGKMA